MNREKADRFIKLVEIGMLVYTVVAAGLGYMLGGPAIMYAIALGGCIMYINFLLVVWLVDKMFVKHNDSQRYSVLSGLKSLLMMGTISALIYYQREMGVYTLIGLTNLFFGVFAAAVIYAVREYRDRPITDHKESD